MATTGVFNGNLIVPLWGGTAIGCTTNFTFEVSNDEIDATCKDNSGARQVLMGQQSWNASAEGMQKFDATQGIEELMTDALAKTSRTLRWTTGVTGDKYYEGDAYIGQISLEAPLNDVATWSCSWVGTGALSAGTIS